MSISNEIRKQLESLDHQVELGDEGLVLQAEVGGERLTCELVALGALGCSFSHIMVESDALAEVSVERVQEISKTLAKKLTYLLEPIAPIETDADGCVVQLRSQPPHRVEESRSYYELLVRRGGQISLRRFAKANGVPREATPASVTREVLLRLVDDLVDAVA